MFCVSNKAAIMRNWRIPSPLYSLLKCSYLIVLTRSLPEVLGLQLTGEGTLMLETAILKYPHCWDVLTFIIRKLKSIFREGQFSLFGLAMLILTQTAPGWNAGLQSPNQPLVLQFLITMKSIKRKSFTFLRFYSHFLKNPASRLLWSTNTFFSISSE